MNPGTCDTSEEVAKFYYDGDGNRVKSIIGTETRLFIGAHYEVTNPGSGQTVTKYYSAGGQRIAMRKYTIPSNMTVEYLLGDHLGSTGLTTDTSGTKVSEIRYSWTSGAASTPPRGYAKSNGQIAFGTDEMVSFVIILPKSTLNL